jgi:hypothetical protein
MNERDKDNDSFIAPGSGVFVGGQIVGPDEDLLPGTEDPNGPVPDDEEDHDAAEEDEGLLDTDSPDFDHSMRRRS